MNHQNNFDLLRLFAACQVVYLHASGHLGLPKGGILFDVVTQFQGVAVFFVISGFLVSDSYLRNQDISSFLFKRALRIYPALIVNILVLELAYGATGGLATTAWAYGKYLSVYLVTASGHFANLAFGGSPTYTKSWFFPWYPSGVLWTLTVELSFYLVLPLVLALVARARILGATILFCLMAGSFIISTQATFEFYAAHPSLNELIVPYFWIFGIGVAARVWWDAIAKLFEDKALWWLAICSTLTYISVSVFNGRAYLEYKIAPDFLVCIRTIVMACTVLSAAFTARHLASILRGNDLSYGLYLWHMLIVTSLVALNLRGHWWLWIIVYGLGFALAAASWFFVEKPALRLKGRSAFVTVLAPESPTHFRMER